MPTTTSSTEPVSDATESISDAPHADDAGATAATDEATLLAFTGDLDPDDAPGDWTGADDGQAATEPPSSPETEGKDA